MIPRTASSCQSNDQQASQVDCPSSAWQKALANAIREPLELLDYLELPRSLLEPGVAASQSFSLRVPREYCQRIEKGNPEDPLLLQVLPAAAELIESSQYSRDPVGDLAAIEVPGLLHKYRGRALLITTPACAVHCRYCFRRHFPYQENRVEQNWQQAMEYIGADENINEVILSGGDPLSMTESRLSALTEQLRQIPHIKTLRIHTRLPIVLPERINAEFLSWLNSLPWKVVIVLHCNHANEIDESVKLAIAKLQQPNITLLNQSVLLARVNDNADILTRLSQSLFECGVLPYYLHMLDKVQGAQHFHVSTQSATKLLEQVRDRLPGYLVPKLVIEEAGELSKTPVI